MARDSRRQVPQQAARYRIHPPHESESLRSGIGCACFEGVPMKLMPCDFCKELHDAIDLESVGAMVSCSDCRDAAFTAREEAKQRSAEELEVMRSRGDL
jgi:hypothetical protein